VKCGVDDDRIGGGLSSQPPQGLARRSGFCSSREISKQGRLVNELSKTRQAFGKSQRGVSARREDVAGIERRTGAAVRICS
jgi:hypothetical protein